ncbi:M1 family metallopeptidase [Pelobium manganitolerans]|uniref:M1 family metallopeptidase n=1 Tax=Pelobium manganitolerans TaxID=1842495 RepID=UPI003FA3A766
MKALRAVFTFITMLLAMATNAQKLVSSFSKADSLRGDIHSPLRTCYDINFYHLNVAFDLAQKNISGSNLFKFTATRDFKRLQFDLFANLNIQKVEYHGQQLPVERLYDAVFLTFDREIKAGAQDSFRVYYSGKPHEAKNAPWDGGMVFSKTADNSYWVATACQGLGASAWWPNKDQQADEVDSALISINVQKGLTAVSNGRLVAKKELNNGYTRFDWKVENPINNYAISANIAPYTQISDSYNGLNGKLALNYYVLPQDVEKAKNQFKQVKQMLEAFEYWFGPYPFYKDGYKIVQTPFLGMEHQSAVAYGNEFKNGYLGRDLSGTGWGLKWDFIIVHESAHEWFGNNITAKDIADMWLHESFTTYAESLFTEYWYGEEAGAAYVIGQRNLVQNDKPIIGTYGVNSPGSGDMYFKGANLLHTIRQLVNNDEKWRNILRGLNTTFGKKTCTGTEIIAYLTKETGLNLVPAFEQYLNYTNIPTLETKNEAGKVWCRWLSDVSNFEMPIKTSDGKWLFPKTTWTVLADYNNASQLKIEPNFYINFKRDP